MFFKKKQFSKINTGKIFSTSVELESDNVSVPANIIRFTCSFGQWIPGGVFFSNFENFNFRDIYVPENPPKWAQNL